MNTLLKTRASIANLLKTYFELAKPERTLANVLTAAAGFLFASQWEGDWLSFVALIVGSTLVIGSACVLNNFLDRDLDRKMARTKNRALASRQVSGVSGIIYGVFLGVLGFAVAAYANWLTVAVLATGYFSYVVLYGLAKRYTVYSTLIGAVPGAASLVAGYTAAANRLDEAAVILFFIMLSWQMVHFYAIGIYRLKDYAAAKIPVWPVKYGIKSTKIQMFIFLILFIFSSSLLTWGDYTGYFYLGGVLLLSTFWLQTAFSGYQSRDDAQWARKMFKFSLIVLLGMSVLLAIGPVLP